MRMVPLALTGALLVAAGAASADQTRIRIDSITAQGVGPTIGTMRLVDTKEGLRLTPLLKSLPPGVHGMHVHAKGDCGPGPGKGAPEAGLAAGGHFDPDKTGRHAGPKGVGHRGDLPVLMVGQDGIAHRPVIAPHLTLAAIKGLALVIHAGGDNYADRPAPLGGGGARIACGVIR